MANEMLENRVNFFSKLDEKLNNFYDTRATPWYKEAAKHFVPTYTAHRLSDVGHTGLSLIGAGVDIGKIFGYMALIKEITKLFQA